MSFLIKEFHCFTQPLLSLLFLFIIIDILNTGKWILIIDWKSLIFSKYWICFSRTSLTIGNYTCILTLNNFLHNTFAWLFPYQVLWRLLIKNSIKLKCLFIFWFLMRILYRYVILLTLNHFLLLIIWSNSCKYFIIIILAWWFWSH